MRRLDSSEAAQSGGKSTGRKLEFPRSFWALAEGEDSLHSSQMCPHLPNPKLIPLPTCIKTVRAPSALTPRGHPEPLPQALQFLPSPK